MLALNDWKEDLGYGVQSRGVQFLVQERAGFRSTQMLDLQTVGYITQLKVFYTLLSNCLNHYP